MQLYLYTSIHIIFIYRKEKLSFNTFSIFFFVASIFYLNEKRIEMETFYLRKFAYALEKIFFLVNIKCR